MAVRRRLATARDFGCVPFLALLLQFYYLFNCLSLTSLLLPFADLSCSPRSSLLTVNDHLQKVPASCFKKSADRWLNGAGPLNASFSPGHGDIDLGAQQRHSQTHCCVVVILEPRTLNPFSRDHLGPLHYVHYVHNLRGGQTAGAGFDFGNGRTPGSLWAQYVRHSRWPMRTSGQRRGFRMGECSQQLFIPCLSPRFHGADHLFSLPSVC
jgi:hypothetical protein